MTRQLAEALRIDLRGEGLLNSKSEYNTCPIPGRKVDLQVGKLNRTKTDSSNQEGEQDKRNHEAEESLQERDHKRKNPDVPRNETRKCKRRILELLNNWGENENCNLMDDDQFENIPDGWWKPVDAMSSNEEPAAAIIPVVPLLRNLWGCLVSQLSCLSV